MVSERDMSPHARNLVFAFLASVIVVGLFAVDGWYGRSYYAQDAISYLDVARAVERGDWRTALSPYWSIGYPVLIAAVRGFFPAGPMGEWTAVHVLNLVIMAATYGAFLYFLRVALTFTARVNGGEKAGENTPVFVIGTAIFLLWQLQCGNASRVSPDPLVGGIFFLVVAVALNFSLRPSAKTAMALGFLLGAGFLVKSVYSALALGVLGVLVLQALTRPGRLPTLGKLAAAIPLIVLVALPYVVGLSHAVGKFTLGESSGLNYAWNVNAMPRSLHWQGGPGPFGAPVHPTHLEMKEPPLFTFAEPFHVTYSPWYNAPYWYEGYHGFFNAKNQARTIAQNLAMLRRCFFEGAHATVEMILAGVLLALGIFMLGLRREWLVRLGRMWLLLLLPISAICVYLPVFIDIRYIVSFVIVLLVAPFLPIFVPSPLISRGQATMLATFIAVLCGLIIASESTGDFYRALHRKLYTEDPEWILGLNLAPWGIQPGDRVAAVNPGGDYDCAWASAAQVRIVAEIGNDAYDRDHQPQDIALFTDHPDVQQTAFALFEKAGAKAVILVNHPDAPQGPGWCRVPGTNFWLHFLSKSENIDKS